MGSVSTLEFLVRALSLFHQEIILISKSSYSTTPEILQYFKTLADTYGLRKYIQLSHKVVGAWWKEETQE
jgi:cation diffusion facilitator CzcD-associated flavoprotein CzcO